MCLVGAVTNLLKQRHYRSTRFPVSHGLWHVPVVLAQLLLLSFVAGLGVVGSLTIEMSAHP